MTPLPEVCVGAIVVCGDEMLIVRRGRGAGTGLWSIPGGRVEYGETLKQAVARELNEETGIHIVEWTHLGHVERITPDWHFVIHDFLTEVPVSQRPIPVAGDDASEVRWVVRADLVALPGVVPGLCEFLAEHRVIPPLA